MGSKQETYTVQSDENLLAILRTIRENDLHGVTEIADTLSLAKSTVHSHLATLEDHGFITRSAGGYYIGFRFLDYGIFARNTHPLFQAANRSIDDLAENTTERVWCVVEDNSKAVYLYGASGRHAIQTYERVGRHTTLHDIAAGKAILAFLPRERVKEIVERSGLEQRTADTITDPATLYEELEVIRERGVSYNLEESMKGVNAVGAPVKKVDGGVYGAISIGGPANRLTEDLLQNEVADLLLGTANEIEINIRHM